MDWCFCGLVLGVLGVIGILYTVGCYILEGHVKLITDELMNGQTSVGLGSRTYG